jgi:hypothetical protein
VNYETAFDEAQAKADQFGVDYGIAKNMFGGYSVFRLPQPENRSGLELRCQVVKPKKGA